MIRRISCGNTSIQYNLSYKAVKNINLRIKPDGTVHVSANRSVPMQFVDDFVLSKANFITRATEKLRIRKDIERIKYRSEEELYSVVVDICMRVYPYYEGLGIEYPHIRIRNMVSRWGSCHTVKNIITLNTYLIYAPIECVEYVILHEFTHFLQANHSAKFYEELSKVCPDWKRRRKQLNEIVIR